MTQPRNSARPRERATVADVAALAGVAASSVSRVLGGNPGVSEQLRARVVKAATQLDYAPDPNAASLRSGHTFSIGTVVRDFSSPLYAAIVHGAEVSLREHGYSTLVANSAGDAELGLQLLQTFGRRRVDGLILSLDSDGEDFTHRVLSDARVPIVLIDRDVPAELVGDRLGVVQCDHYTGCRSAIEQLVEAGHSRIGFLGGPLSIRPWRERMRAYEDVLGDAGIQVDPSIVFSGGRGVAIAQERADAMISDRAPTALFAGSVEHAIGVLLALGQLAPEQRRQVSVVSCDEVPLMDLADCPLLIVDRDREAIGARAAAHLLGLLAGESPGSIEVIPTFVRGTVGEVAS